jgi:hypothetical protein
MTFEKVNPTKYYVDITNGEGDYFLVLNNNFHKGWRVYLEDGSSAEEKLNFAQSILKQVLEKATGLLIYLNGESSFLSTQTFEVAFLREISTKSHFMANGFANSWVISPSDTGNQDSYRLVIEFWPQQVFYIAFYSAHLLFLFSVVYVILYTIKKMIFYERKRN